MSAVPSIHCDACGRNYAWKAELAGKKVKCKCGGVIVVPMEPAKPTPQAGPPVPAAPHEPERMPTNRPVYDLDADMARRDPIPRTPPRVPEAPPTQADACPDCGNPITPNAVICINCGLNLKTGQHLQTKLESPETPARPAPKIAKPTKPQRPQPPGQGDTPK